METGRYFGQDAEGQSLALNLLPDMIDDAQNRGDEVAQRLMQEHLVWQSNGANSISKRGRRHWVGLIDRWLDAREEHIPGVLRGWQGDFLPRALVATRLLLTGARVWITSSSKEF
jgi:hypothetical protein